MMNLAVLKIKNVSEMKGKKHQANNVDALKKPILPPKNLISVEDLVTSLTYQSRFYSCLISFH